MPGHSKGVINLRGKIIPVMDLRIKFSLANADESVTNIAAKDLEPNPDFGTSFVTDYLLVMAKLEGRFVALLDIHKVVAA